MKEYLSVLSTCALFEGIANTDLHTMLACLSARERRYAKGEVIFLAGQPATHLGIVLEGSADIMQADFWGNESLLSRVGPGDLFGEAFAAAQAPALPVSVLAAGLCAVLLLDYRRVLTTCTNACQFHDGIIDNMLRVLARKNIALTQKMEHLTRRTTREKLLSYLSRQAAQAGSDSFTIPFDRQALAAYLSVDRSAMSTELGNMRREGLIDFDKNRFTLHTGIGQ